jgi:methylated-DNA-protein-cysteine methyltransferase-like protein
MLVHETDLSSLEKYKAIHGIVLRIPIGKVASYGQVASLAGLPGRARLAGKALGTTINQSKIPWYRVLRSDGRIAFAEGTEQHNLQASLLRQESVIVNKGKVRMRDFQWDPFESQYEPINEES